jgi:hypothetical protein
MVFPNKIEKVYSEEYTKVPKILFTPYVMGVISDSSHGHC